MAKHVKVVAIEGEDEKPEERDWVLIRESFVMGIERDNNSREWPTYQELADAFQLPMSTVAQRGSREHWVQLKREYQSDIETAKKQLRITELAVKSVDFDESAFNMAKLGMAIVTNELVDNANKQKLRNKMREENARVRREGGFANDSDIDFIVSVDPKEIANLAASGAAFHLLGRKALGTDVQRHELSGPEGNPIAITASVTEELQKDDSERLADFLAAIDRTVGLSEAMPGLAAAFGIDNVVDAELVDDEEGGES